MSEHLLAAVRKDSAEQTRKLLSFARADIGSVAIPSIAQGILEAVVGELVRQFGPRYTYEVVQGWADKIVEDDVNQRRYLEALYDDIKRKLA